MTDKMNIRFDRDRELAIIQTGSGPTVELNESEYHALIRDLTEICGTGWAEIHRIEREHKLKEYIKDHPDCTYLQIMNDIGDPDNNMGYLSVTYSLTNMVERGTITVSVNEHGKRQYRATERLI